MVPQLRDLPVGYPDIVYQRGHARYALHETSSLIHEMAPIVLCMRHVLAPGGFVIIEEPEAHLHPAAQIVLARAFARLVTGGANLLITTHSDYFLQQIDNCILTARLSPRARRENGYANEEAIDPDRVAAYLFEGQAAARSTRVHKLELTPDYGITDDEFTRVAEGLYAETVALQRGVLRRA